MRFTPSHLSCITAALLLLAGCSDGNRNPVTADSAAAAELGDQIFHDASLSASGQLSCASCHDPSKAHASDAAVNIGGAAMNVSGTRNAPSLRYLDLTPAFFFDRDGTPTGGFDRDGRANSLVEQARRPFLAPHEMDNASPAAVVARLKAAPYAEDFRKLFGADIFEQGDSAFERALLALAAYQLNDSQFHPYSSKYDDFLRGRASLTPQEQRGLALFNDPQRGNCAGCHPSARGSRGELPLFTDFTYDNLGVPRNPGIPANADPAYFDLGLCGPDRTDLDTSRPADRSLCGAFKVPTLRNIAKTAPYFHNGRFETLKEALSFYVTRDTRPQDWYASADDKFDDLPAEYKTNVNQTEVPYNRRAGDAPALSDADIDDVIAFLNTLTDADLR